MKKFLVMLPLFLVLFLCGCKGRNELGNNGIVTVFFVDFGENQFEITAETADFTKDKKEKKILFTSKGETLNKAYSLLEESMTSTPYEGHTAAIILGDELCKNLKIKDTIGFFADMNILSPNISIFLTEDSPSDFKEGTIYSAVKKEMLSKAPLYTFFLSENEISLIPVISCIDGLPESTGAAICENLNFKYYLTEDEYRLYRLLTDKLNKKYYKSFEIISSKGKISVNNNTLNIKLQTKTKNPIDEILLKEDIYRLIEKSSQNGFKALFSKNEWDNTEISVTTLIANTGKIKNRR